MQRANTIAAFQQLSVRLDVIDAVSASGWMHNISFEQREAILQVVNELVFKRKTAIEHLREDLASMNILHLLQSKRQSMMYLLVFQETDLTSEKRAFSLHTFRCSSDMNPTFLECKKY